MNDFIPTLQHTLTTAIKEQRTLAILGGGSKQHLTSPTLPDAQPCDIKAHQGIIIYEPTELIITVKAGTRLKEVLETLNEQQQLLSFEPPLFSEQSTVGGMIASGISGTTRPWKGLIRDCLLGCTLLNGQGEIVKFGGQVFKNVAGFDLFRPQAGAWGTLGVLLDVTLRVNPQARQTRYFSLECNASKALEMMQQWQQHPHPITGLCWHEDTLYCRLQGFQSAIDYSLKQLPNLQETPHTQSFWQQLNTYQLPIMQAHSSAPAKSYKCFTQNSTPLIPNININFIDWGGAIRWYHADEIEQSITQEHLLAHCSHYEKWHLQENKAIEYSPQPNTIKKLQQRIREAFDPHHIFNQHIR